jgi:hypothetical protein
MMRIPIGLAGLLVGAVMSFLAPAARAEFSMQVLNNPTGDGFKIDENATHTAFSLLTFGSVQASDVTWSATSGVIHAVATIDGYTFNMYGRSNQETIPTPTMGQVSLNGSVTTNPGASASSFSFYASDSPFTFPGTSTDKLQVQAKAFTGSSWNTGDLIQTQTQYTAQLPGNVYQQYLSGMAGPLGGPNQSASSNVVTVPTRGTQYALSGLGGTVGTTGNVGTSSFWMQTVTSMPEPTGIVIGLLGLPGVGALVSLARRRVAQAVTLA